MFQPYPSRHESLRDHRKAAREPTLNNRVLLDFLSYSLPSSHHKADGFAFRTRWPFQIGVQPVSTLSSAELGGEGELSWQIAVARSRLLPLRYSISSCGVPNSGAGVLSPRERALVVDRGHRI